MEEKFSINVFVREEEMEDGRVFVVNSEELGVSDFGDTLDEALENFRKSARMFLDVYPERKECLIEEERQPLLLSRILL